MPKYSQTFASRLLGQLIIDPGFARQYIPLIEGAADVFERYELHFMVWDALQSFRTAYKKHPSTSDLREEVAHRLRSNKDADAALIAFDEIVAIRDPDQNKQWLETRLLPQLQREVLRKGLLDVLQGTVAEGDDDNDELIAALNATLARAGTVGSSALSVVTLDTVQPEPVRWLWSRRVPFGALTLIEGNPGFSKTTILIDIAARRTRGAPMPGDPQEKKPRPGHVIFLGHEDSLRHTIRPRFDLAGGDAKFFHVIQSSIDRTTGASGSVSLSRDMRQIEAVMRRLKSKLLLIDPLLPYLGGKTDAHRDSDVRIALAPLLDMCERRNVAAIALRHLTKNHADRTAISAGLGSIGISAVARSVLLCAPHPTDEGTFCLASSKSNLSKRPETIAYRTREDSNEMSYIEWAGQVPYSADDLLSSASGGDKSALADAIEFLKEALPAGSSRSAKDVRSEATVFGVAGTTLTRARHALKIRCSKTSLAGGWEWRRPGATATAEDDTEE